VQPNKHNDIALPRPSHEGLFGTIYCSRCRFFGLGHNHPEWCTWEWLRQAGTAIHSLDLIELGALVVESFNTSRVMER
jgi:hypothetical protein